MKKLREIVFKTLVDILGVPANLLSRIEGDEPIGIELVDGEEIFISFLYMIRRLERSLKFRYVTEEYYQLKLQS